MRKINPGETAWMGGNTGERAEFAEFYKAVKFEKLLPPEVTICNGPISYIGEQEVANDLAVFKNALAEAGARAEETFMCVLAPGWLEHFFHNEHYANDEQYLFALADAMKHEYKAIVDAGFILQLDDPALPDTYDMIVPTPTIAEYRKFAEVRIDALNHALQGLPEDRVRYHICWGSWHGPHTHDLPLKYLVDLMLKVKAGAYSVEAANPRHEHEWKVWKDVKLPDSKILIPGVSATQATLSSIPSWWPTALRSTRAWWGAKTSSPEPIVGWAGAFIRRLRGPNSRRCRKARRWRANNSGDADDLYQGIRPSSLKYPPVGPSSPIVAYWMAATAPWAAVRGPLFPLRSWRSSRGK